MSALDPFITLPNGMRSCTICSRYGNRLDKASVVKHIASNSHKKAVKALNATTATPASHTPYPNASHPSSHQTEPPVHFLPFDPPPDASRSHPYNSSLLSHHRYNDTSSATSPASAPKELSDGGYCSKYEGDYFTPRRDLVEISVVRTSTRKREIIVPIEVTRAVR
jgi:hypothetical protein